MLSFWYLSAEVEVLIDFWRRVCTVTFSPAVLCKRWERCTLTASDSDSEVWEHNRIWLAVWIIEAGWRSFRSPTLLSWRYIWYFICIQTTQRLRQCKPQGNSDKGLEEKAPSFQTCWLNLYCIFCQWKMNIDLWQKVLNDLIQFEMWLSNVAAISMLSISYRFNMH